MTAIERNDIFEQYQRLVYYTVNRNRPMLKKLRMSDEDMAQELAICLLKAIEDYDENRGMKPVSYYLTMLQYGVLKLNQVHTRQCRAANLTAQPLVRINDDGEEIEINLPYIEDFDGGLCINEFIGSLSERERKVVDCRLEGVAVTDKRQKSYLNLIKRKAARFCALGGI